MDEREFNELYNTAIKKIAVGFYILDNCGERLGYDVKMISSNKLALCGILAEGVNLSLTTVYADAQSVHLPVDYIRQLQHSGLLDELIAAMQFELKEENQIRLQNA